jgi:hypothetical protein
MFRYALRGDFSIHGSRPNGYAPVMALPINVDFPDFNRVNKL